MNKSENKEIKSKRIEGKIKDFAIVIGLAIVLCIAVWRVFYTDENPSLNVSSAMSDTEKKISRLLSQIEGVGESEVMIYESEDGMKSAVVVCDGAKDFKVLISVREAVATALGMEEKEVKIYLKKE